MAARLNKRHSDMVRKKIQTSQLINLLQDHALGEKEISDSQRDSAKFLINKSISNPPAEQDINVSGDITIRAMEFGNCTPEQLET